MFFWSISQTFHKLHYFFKKKIHTSIKKSNNKWRCKISKWENNKNFFKTHDKICFQLCNFLKKIICNKISNLNLILVK